MFGGLGYLLTDEDLVSLFTGLTNHLVKDGLFVFEFWSIGGLKPSPYQSWLKIHNDDLTLYRLSESNFDVKTDILDIDMHYIVIRNDRLAEKFTETHRIRCYELPAMQEYLNNNGFELISAYDWDSKEIAGLAALRKDTFRILAVSKRWWETHSR